MTQREERNRHVALLTFDARTGAMAPNPTAPLAVLPAGCGPRHLALHPTLPVAYVMCELASSVVPLAYDRATGVLAAPPGGISPVSTLRGGAAAPTVQAGADVIVSPDGRFLYATNRAAPAGTGENSVAVFEVAADTGALSPKGWADGGGSVNFPRHAALSPGEGALLVTANQHGASYTVFARSLVTGALTLVGTSSAAPITAPGFIALLPIAS